MASIRVTVILYIHSLACEGSRLPGDVARLRCVARQSVTTGGRVVLNWSYRNLTGRWNLEKTRLSTKGQIIVPRAIRLAHQWGPGAEFLVEEVSEGILLRPLKPFAPTLFKDVAGSL